MKRLFYCLLVFPLVLGACSSSSDDGGDDENLYVKLNSNDRLVSVKGGSFDVNVTSNTTWTVESKSNWLHPQTTQGEGDRNVAVRFDETDEEKRVGTIVFTAEGGSFQTLAVTQTSRTFSNPVANIMPDPYIIYKDGWYYLCKAGTGGIYLSRSQKLSQITGTSRVWTMPADNISKPWNTKNLWAPELHWIDGYWYIYYAAGNDDSGFSSQRTGVLRGTGEDATKAKWEDMGMIYTGESYQPGITPTVNNTYYAIDMTVFEHKGQLYAVWSGYIAGGSEQRQYIATMENPWTINSNRVEISRATYGWELVGSSKIHEGSAVLVNEEHKRLFISYSTNGSWTKNYCIGYIELNDWDADPMLASSWTKHPNQAFYRCDNTTGTTYGVNGVGHNCFTKSPDGTEDWIVYHTKRTSEDGWDNRPMFVQKINWNADGTPDFGKPVGWGEEIEVPSGEAY